MKSDPDYDTGDGSWTFAAHPDRQFLSINDGIHGDTLLRIGGQLGAPGDLDVERAHEFVDYVNTAVYNARISQYEPITVFEIDHGGEWQSYVPKWEYDRDLDEAKWLLDHMEGERDIERGAVGYLNLSLDASRRISGQIFKVRERLLGLETELLAFARECRDEASAHGETALKSAGLEHAADALSNLAATLPTSLQEVPDGWDGQTPPEPTETYVPLSKVRERLEAEAEKLERPNELGEDFTAAAVRKVKAQGIRDAAAAFSEQERT